MKIAVLLCLFSWHYVHNALVYPGISCKPRFHLQESDVDEEGEEEVDDEVEDEGENESKADAGADDVPTKMDFVPTVAREPERQLSKKELKKKELADLEAVLAELGLDKKEEKEENGEYFLHDVMRLAI